MNILIYLALIQFIIVSIIDDSGVIDSIKRALSKFLTHGKFPTADYRIKPFDCSYCMNFWCGLIYLFIIGQFNIPYIAFVLLLSGLTPITKDLINLVRDLIIKAINKIYDLIQ